MEQIEWQVRFDYPGRLHFLNFIQITDLIAPKVRSQFFDDLSQQRSDLVIIENVQDGGQQRQFRLPNQRLLLVFLHQLLRQKVCSPVEICQ